MPREAAAAKKARALKIEETLREAYPESHCALAHTNAFELLVATILSAQTTDLAVNRATPRLFAEFPDPASMAAAPDGSIETIIGGIGLWRAKSKNLRAMSKILVDKHGGEVPRDLDALMDLPGVGKKTATAVLGTAYGIAAGVTVDTHMVRINHLLALTRNRDPDKIAADIEALLPPDTWPSYTHRIIDHGRLVCVALRPRCGVCPLAKLCPSAFNPEVGYQESHDETEPASKAGLSWIANPSPSQGGTTPGRPAPFMTSRPNPTRAGRKPATIPPRPRAPSYASKKRRKAASRP